MPTSNTGGAAAGSTLATNVVINTSINNSGLASGVQQANQVINTIGSGGGLNAATTGVLSFKAQLKAATAEALRLQQAGLTGTQAYREQVKIIAQLKDEMETLGRASKAFDPGNKFQALNKVAGLAASSFGALTGTFKLLGVSADTANESIAKLQSIQAIIGLLDAFGDAQDVLKPFIQNLLGTNVAVAVQTTTVSANTAAQQANLLVTSQSTIVQNDLKIAELARIAALEAQTLAEAQIEEARLVSIGTTSEQVIQQQQLAIATAEAAAAARAQAAAQTIQTTVTGGATLATKVLGTALKGLGIGLIIAAVAYLITNWDELKKTFLSFLPSGQQTGEIFNTIKTAVVGVGDAVVSFLIAPFKAFIDLVRGDWKKALADIQNGLDVVGNYEQGSALARQSIRDKAAREELEKSIKVNEEKIKHQKELGINTIALERQLFADRKKLAEDDEKESAKVESERQTFENEITKKRMDKAKEAAKKLAELKKAIRKEADKDNIDALKVLEKGYVSDRTKEELAVTESYKAKLTITKKAYGENSTQAKTLLDAQATELGEVKLKYDKILDKAFEEQNDKALNSYDLRIKQLQDKYNELRKNNPESADAINAFVTSETTKIRTEETVNKNVITDEVNLTNPALSEKDKQAAELQLLADKYQQEGLLKSQSDDEKVLAEAKYNEAVYKVKTDYAQKDRDLKSSQEQAEQKLQDTKAAIAESGLSTLGTLFGKNKILADALFAVEKGLAIGQIIVSAQRSIAQATANLAATPAVIGIIPNPAYAIQAAATLKGIAATKLSAALGIANIVGQSVGKLMGGGSSPSTGSGTSGDSVNYNQAPQINTNTSSTTTAVQDVRITNSAPIKAYLTEKDIKTSRDKEAFYANLSDV